MQQPNANARSLRKDVEPIIVVWTCAAGTIHKQPLRLPRDQARAAVISLMLRLSRTPVSA